MCTLRRITYKLQYVSDSLEFSHRSTQIKFVAIIKIRTDRILYICFQILATSSIIGILVGLSSAWIILILTTFNYVIGTLAVIIIGLVSACVIGIIPLAGWKLGVSYSLTYVCLVCLVVFSA